MMKEATLRDTQEKKAQRLFRSLARNPFYQHKLASCFPFPLENALAIMPALPFTTKREIEEDVRAHPPFGTNLSHPLEAYTRFCQSSGSQGTPVPSLDTAADWAAMLDVWDEVFEQAGIAASARILFAFSFGPFLGFWTAFEAATRRGNLVIPSGGLQSEARLQLLARFEVEVLCCTPTYALRLGNLLREQPEHLRQQIQVRSILVAGEPGGSIAATRERIHQLWGARVHDHHGMTETGPVTYEVADRPGSLVVHEASFHAEVLNSNDLEVALGESGELVLTTLDRIGRPLIRYRTGDLVRKGAPWHGRLCLDGGILGRIDDMIIVRGVNIYPSAIEAVLRRFSEIAEYQVRPTTRAEMVELEVLIEILEHVADPEAIVDQASSALYDAFSLRIAVSQAPPNSLPRSDFKSRRWLLKR